MPDIRVVNLTKKFGKVTALENINLEVHDQEYFSLLGPSGCGKTTLLRLIAGLIEPDSGEIWIGDKRVDKVPPEDREIGFVFQTFALFPHMSVWDNVLYGPKVKNFNMKEAKTVGDEVLELVKLHERLDAYPGELSGGMMQRTAVARALACEPALLFADEPTTNLDVTIQAQVLDLMKDLKAKLGMSMVMITHDMGIVADITSRVVVLYAGRVCEIASTSVLYDRPLHPYTEALLAAVPRIDQRKTLQLIPGNIPNLISPPSGCRFHPRCPYAVDICKDKMPELEEIEEGHFVACYEWKNLNLKGV